MTNEYYIFISRKLQFYIPCLNCLFYWPNCIFNVMEKPVNLCLGCLSHFFISLLSFVTFVFCLILFLLLLFFRVFLTAGRRCVRLFINVWSYGKTNYRGSITWLSYCSSPFCSSKGIASLPIVASFVKDFAILSQWYRISSKKRHSSSDTRIRTRAATQYAALIRSMIVI